MNRHVTPLRIVLALLTIGLAPRAKSASSSSPSSSSSPNIIVFMVDDLGWNHISPPQPTMGTAKNIYQTPALEKLANQGVSFTHAYAQPNCAPTRAAMLSGQYPARIHNSVYVVNNLNRHGRGGITKEKATFIGPKQSEDVAADAVTVAEALKKNGYATAHIGKYHVGGHSGDETLPENVGFDINLGGFSQGHQPSCFAKESKEGWKFKGVGRGHFDRFGAPYTKAYVKERKLPASLVGTPKHISDALGDALEETVRTFAAGKKPFYIQFHTYAVHGPVRARPDLKAAATKRLGTENANMAEYVGFISGVDENVARIQAMVEDPNGDGDTADSIAAETLILFTSDNGGTHANNEPLRGHKGMLTEGGMRVPLIAVWPGKIPPNTVTDHMVHVIDYYPTYLALAGNKWVPDTKVHPLDGESFADVLLKPDTNRNRGPLYFLFPGYMDTRAEPSVVAIDEVNGKRYKQFYFYETDAWELYCLNDDIGETNNLISSKPKIASGISKKINAWLTQDHPTWKPQYPISKQTGKPAGPPPVL